MKHKQHLEKILYCLDGYIHDHNDRNYGDAEQWLRHIRSEWENFIESHPDSLTPEEYIIKVNKNEIK